MTKLKKSLKPLLCRFKLHIAFSWNDAQEFIRKLNLKTGKKYRLPSETEWEYAARGRAQTQYSYFNDSPRVIDQFGLCNQNQYNSQHAQSVGQLKPNEYGLYDAIGNVAEWTQDDYVDSYNAGRTQSFHENASSPQKVTRGGAWANNPENCRSASRSQNSPIRANNLTGFRLSITLDRDNPTIEK